MADGLSHLFVLEERDFLLFWYGWSRLDSDHGECWMGGGSYAGLELQLNLELMLGQGDWQGDWQGLHSGKRGAADEDM